MLILRIDKRLQRTRVSVLEVIPDASHNGKTALLDSRDHDGTLRGRVPSGLEGSEGAPTKVDDGWSYHSSYKSDPWCNAYIRTVLNTVKGPVHEDTEVKER